VKFLYADITPEENQRRRQDFADMLVDTFGHLLDEPELIARCKAAESADADESADEDPTSRRRPMRRPPVAGQDE